MKAIDQYSYRKTPVISPGLTKLRKGFCVSLERGFFGGGGAYKRYKKRFGIGNNENTLFDIQHYQRRNALYAGFYIINNCKTLNTSVQIIEQQCVDRYLITAIVIKPVSI